MLCLSVLTVRAYVSRVSRFFCQLFDSLAPWHRDSACDCRITTASPVADWLYPFCCSALCVSRVRGLYYILCFWRWTLVFLRPAWVFLPLPLFSVSGPGSSAPWGGIHDGFRAHATPSDEPFERARRLTDDGIYCLACSANTQYLGLNRSSSTR